MDHPGCYVQDMTADSYCKVVTNYYLLLSDATVPGCFPDFVGWPVFHMVVHLHTVSAPVLLTAYCLLADT